MKKILTWIDNNKLLLIVALVLAVVVISVRGCINEKRNANRLLDAIKAKEDSITYWKDSNGKEHARLTQVEASKNEIEFLYKNRLDSVSKELNIKPKQVSEYTSVSTKNTGTFTTKIDTIYKEKIVDGKTIKEPEYAVTGFKDNWIDFKAKIHGNIMDAEYSITDSLTIVGYWKRKGFLGLGKKDYFIDISSANPNTKITNAKNFKVASSQPSPFGVGFIGGYGWNGIKFSPFIGVGVYYKIF